jgi:hypothetical protein
MDDSRPRLRGLIPLLAGALALGACTPDPDKSYDDFLDRIADASMRPDAPILAQIPDITGRFLVGMAGSPQPDTPFHFISVNVMTDNGDGTATLQMTLTPLTIAERTLVGDPYAFPATQVSMTGEFVGEVTKAVIPAPADPILGADLTIEPFTATGTIVSEDVFCGDAAGWLTSPLSRDLAGSTFGAIRVSETAIGDELPTVEPRCPTGNPDAGVPDAAVPSPDANVADANVADANVADANVADANVADANVADANTPDSGI